MAEEELDHPDDLSEDALTEEEQDVYALFAEALDPNNPKTVDEAAAEWRELLS